MSFNVGKAGSGKSTGNRRLNISAPVVAAKVQDLSSEKDNLSKEEVKQLVADSPADLTGLLRDPQEVEKVVSANPLAMSEYEKEGREKALKIMNAFRTLGPAISRALKSSTTEDEQAQYLINTSAFTQKTAIKTAEVMGVNHTSPSNRWMINVLERIYMESLPDEILEDSEIGEKLIKAIYAVAAEREQEKSDKDIRDVPLTLSVQLALIKAMAPIIKEQSKFDFFRERDADLERLANIIMNSAAEAVKEMLDPLTKEEDRVIAYKVFVEEAGKCLADSWEIEAVSVKEALSSRSEAEVSALLASRPDGLSIDKVLTNFENQFRRLKMLSTLAKSPK